MTPFPLRNLLCFSVSLALSPIAFGHDHLEETVITGVQTDNALTLSTDPRAPRQPLPAQDGADYLKTIPGFSVVRKGGTGGDPVFRGMAGSRLSLLLDGNVVLGGCSSRMDPPTAYVFPESYDSIRLIKGPQTVLYGPGNSAGVVLFERDSEQMAEAGVKVHASALAGSFGRDDETLNVVAGTPAYYVRAGANHSQQDNYSDGDGNEVHARYDRWSTNLALGWTPSENTTLELSGVRSGAEAAYADRGMDGTLFERDNLSLKLTMDDLSPRWKTLEAQVFYNYVDHVMDNYTLREPGGMMPMLMASNRDRQTEGARLLTSFAVTPSAEISIGADIQRNHHTDRGTMNQAMMPYQTMTRVEDASFAQTGVFAEWHQNLADNQRIIAGVRYDDWRATDKRNTISLGMMGMGMTAANPTANAEREDGLTSGFARYEKDLQKTTTLYAGIGHNERFPDYWELFDKESADSLSAFNAKPEATTQLDLGAIYKQGRFRGSASLFYNEISDYLMIQSGVVKPAGMMGTRTAVITRNIDASTWGMEADASFAFNANWRLEASLAAVHGDNETDGTALAQLSPLEVRLGVYYNRDAISAGAFWRAVDEQDRVDIGKGNIAGQDIGISDSFNVFSINLGWQATPQLLITSGVDNLFDSTYAEHVSSAGAMIAGHVQTTQVNEPGRNLWLKAQFTFE